LSAISSFLKQAGHDVESWLQTCSDFKTAPDDQQYGVCTRLGEYQRSEDEPKSKKIHISGPSQGETSRREVSWKVHRNVAGLSIFQTLFNCFQNIQ
jgi:hypothetical protein